MPVYSRNLLLFSVLAATALLTWMFARSTDPEPDAPQDSRRPAAQDYYLVDTVLSGTDDNGDNLYRIHAERVERESVEHGYSLEAVRVEYAGEQNVDWELTAARGELARDRELLELSVVRLTAWRGDEADSVIFDAGDLRLELRAKTAVTRQPVRLRSGQCESNARGLDVDLNKDTYELLGMVATCRPRPRAEPWLALALVAGAAVAQDEPAGETYIVDCGAYTGLLRTNTGICRELSITDRGAFRLTAGLLTVLEEEGSGFDPGEWLERGELQLTEGVRLEFETAVLTADSALFVFDANRMLQSFDMVGMPAELSDFIDGASMPFRVSAQRIVYDRESGTLKMPGEFQFLDDDTEGNAGSACDLNYRLEDKTFDIGNPQCGFSLSLSPLSTEDSTEDTPEEP